MNNFKKNAALISAVAMLAQSVSAMPEISVNAAEATGKLFINEVCAKNTEFAAADGGFYDWIEIYNASSQDINISGYGLTDDETRLDRFVFPEGTTISGGQHMIVYCNSSEFSVPGQHCAVFGLSTDGETIILSDNGGNTVDSVVFGAIEANVSYGRVSDGSAEYAFMKMTPGTANNSESIVKIDVPSPVFSTPSGYVSDSLNVSITAQNNAKIYYTLDSSAPTTSSELYSSPIEVSKAALEALRKEAQSQSSTQTPTTPAGPGAGGRPGAGGGLGNWGNIGGWGNFGVSSVTAGAPDAEKDVFVIRAVAVDSDGNMSAPVTASYFLGIQDTASYYQNVKVICISTDSDNLNDSSTGIYANYNESGREWERPASMQIFVNGKEELSQNIGIRIHGGYTRQFNQKSFNIYARDEYGNSKVEYDLFSGNLRSEATGKKIKKFDSFILRNGGNDCEATRFRDKLHQTLVRDRNFLSQAMEPAIVFVNGEFFGQYEITEKISTDYINDHTGVSKKDICIIKNQELEDGDEETYTEYKELGNWIKQTDFSDAEKYAELCTKVDIDSFIDYMSAQIFIGNKDWGKNNVALWKSVKTDESNPYADGRWRFILFDTEYAANMYNQIPASTNTLSNVMNDGSWIGTLLSQAMKNEEFRQKFVNTFMDIANYNFADEKINSLISEYSTSYKEMVVDTYEKFWSDKNESSFNSAVQTVSSFYKDRYSSITSALKSTLSLKGSLASLTVNNDSSKGTVTVNTLTPDMSSGKYTGKYYTDFPVTVTAEPAENFTFAGWKLGDGTVIKTKTAEITLSENTTVTAVYASGNGEIIQEEIAGDVNSDGSVNAADLTVLIKYLTGQTASVSSGDINGDGRINIADLISLKNILIG